MVFLGKSVSNLNSFYAFGEGCNFEKICTAFVLTGTIISPYNGSRYQLLPLVVWYNFVKAWVVKDMVIFLCFANGGCRQRKCHTSHWFTIFVTSHPFSSVPLISFLECRTTKIASMAWAFLEELSVNEAFKSPHDAKKSVKITSSSGLNDDTSMIWVKSNHSFLLLWVWHSFNWFRKWDSMRLKGVILDSSVCQSDCFACP